MFLLSSDKYLEAKLLYCMAVLFLIFCGNFMLFFIATTPIYIPTNSAQVFLFLDILTTFVICCLFDNSHSDRFEVVSHCGFDLHLPDD